MEKKQEQICLGVYISKEDHKRLKEIASEKEKNLSVRVTISDIVRLAIRDCLANNDKK